MHSLCKPTLTSKNCTLFLRFRVFPLQIFVKARNIFFKFSSPTPNAPSPCNSPFHFCIALMFIVLIEDHSLWSCCCIMNTIIDNSPGCSMAECCSGARIPRSLFFLCLSPWKACGNVAAVFRRVRPHTWALRCRARVYFRCSKYILNFNIRKFFFYNHCNCKLTAFRCVFFSVVFMLFFSTETSRPTLLWHNKI